MSSFVVCGAFDSGNGFSDIYADQLTGDVVLDSDLIGRVFMAELSVVDPIEISDEAVLSKLCNHLDCDGVILSNRHLITLKGSTAFYRNYVNKDVIEHTVDFHTDFTADVELD